MQHIKLFSMMTISVILSLLILTDSALSQTPLTTAFTYQGELQQSGQPAVGQFDLQFSVFDALSGGSELSSTVSVDNVMVNDGLFTVELDFGDMPFAGDQLWIEVSVREGASSGGYTMLLPRQKITASPYALHAEMVAANAIGSSEVANNSLTSADLAPNSVRASELANDSVDTAAIQDNAVGLSKIRADKVQARVTGSCTAGFNATAINEDGSIQCDLDDVGLDAAGAVAAMGPISNNNPLNHNRFTGAEAVSAILASDGSGSSLDADLLDGQNAADIISAAGSSSAIEIDSLPFTISSSGTYIFTQSLASSSTNSPGIEVNASFVTIDFNGHTMTGPGSTGNTADGIILSGRQSVIIKNGVIRNFGSQGIIASNTFGNGQQIINMHMRSNGDDGILLVGDGHIIRGCIADGNAGIGVSVAGAGSIIIGNTATNNTEEGIRASSGVLVKNNAVFNNGESGISLLSDSRGESNVVRGNNTSNSLFHGGILVSGNSNAVGNTVDENNEHNVFVSGAGNVVDNNFITNAVTSGSRGFGIYSGTNLNVYRNNILRSNVSGAFGGSIPPAARLIDNIDF